MQSTKTTDVLPESERAEILARHNRQKYADLEARRREILSELLDIETYMEVLGDDPQGCTFYVGMHTNERLENGEPKYKREAIFKTSIPYSQGTKILRGMNIMANKIVGLEKKKFDQFEKFLKLLEGI
ncbi:MAG: hypothetical protein GYA69_04780 [Candidatus Moranbacteria bacterium]|nr:hypothetical protein [Candidatus Moranbacteria bacterium]